MTEINSVIAPSVIKTDESIFEGITFKTFSGESPDSDLAPASLSGKPP